jgi:DNA-binding CsgD family transcriptional regulator
LAAILCVFRGLGGSGYANREVELMRMVLPHLQRAVSVHRKLHGIAIDRDVAQDALNRVGVGVLILDQRGKVLFLNKEAQAIIAQGDGLTLLRDGLSAARPNESAALRRLLVNVVTPTRTDSGGAIHIGRPSGKRPFALLAAPLRVTTFALAPHPPAAIVFVSDPERKVLGIEDVLRQLHGFTPAESAVTVLLLEGASVREVSERLGITWNTARTHVQRILGKTNARTQADLIRMLAPGIAGIRFNADSSDD